MTYKDKNKVKCAKCGTETNTISLVRLAGIARWVCKICAGRMANQNGGNLGR